MQQASSQAAGLGIWAFAFGYFACYVPYSAVAKGTSSGLFPGLDGRTSGIALLPVVAVMALVAFLGAAWVLGWWKELDRVRWAGLSIPVPRRITFASGIATGVTGITTTLAYTFEGVSIVFMMLLMRGGVLAMSPLIDSLTRRKVRWFSMAGLAFCLAALLAAFLGRRAFDISSIALIDIGFYLAAYFFRLQFMSKTGKFIEAKTRRRYFIEEQFVSSIVIVAFLGALALINQGPFMAELRHGFTLFGWSPLFLYMAIIGVAAQGAGVFGSLVLLDHRENSFAVPVNRSSSIVSGIVATLFLAAVASTRMPTVYEWAGAFLILVAIGFLTLPPFLDKRAKQLAGAES